jgi:hypothetical protein
MSVMMVDTSSIAHYVNKEIYDDIDDNTCEICYSNNKDDILSCKTCNKKICFKCFNRNPVKDIGIANPSEDLWENGDGYIYLFMKCFFCRKENKYNTANFTRRQTNILNNNMVKETCDFIKKLKTIEPYNAYELDVIKKTNDIKMIFDIVEENNILKGKLKFYENMEENLMNMKMKLENLNVSYNKNIGDYNNLVNETNFLKNAYKQIEISCEYICNQRDSYKNSYVNGIKEIKSKNKNKNLDKFIDNKLKELDKQTTEDEVNFEIEFNNLVKK